MRFPTAQSPDPLAIDKAAEKWVQTTLKKMTLDEKVGQLLVSSFQSSLHRAPTRDAFAALEKARARVSRRRLPCLRRRGAGAAGAAQPGLRHRDARPAARGGVDAQSAAGAVARCRCSTPPTSRPASASASPARPRFRARWRSAPPATSGSRSRRAAITGVEARAHRRPRQFRAGRRRQQQPAQSGHQHALVRRGSRRSSAGWRPPTSAGCRPAA